MIELAPPGSERSRRALAGLMLTAGVMHFATPRFFDELIPEQLGNARAWTYGSGVAELTAAGLLLHPRTRAAGGWFTAALLVGVFPGNVKMALDTGAPSTAAEWVPWLRLPIQVPLVWWALTHRHRRSVADE